MRDAGERWLPREEKESVKSYDARLLRSVLYGALSDTIGKLTAKPFSKPLRVLGDLPDLLEPIERNADRAGTSLHNVAQDSFRDAASFGVSGFFVDLPNGDFESLGDLQSRTIYPAITVVRGRDIIWWNGSRDASGMVRLGEIRIRESDDEGGDDVDGYRIRRVMSADFGGTPTATWEIWERVKDAWARTSNGTISHRNIPFEPWYTNQDGLLKACPPLEDLGWLNVRHWQSGSDQANILRYARVAQPWATGITEDESEKMSIAAVSQFLHSTSKEARFGMLEHSGAAIEAGRNDLQDLEARMETLGLQPFIERVGNQTATGVVAGQSGTMTIIQSWIRNEEAALRRALIIAHELLGEKNAPIDPDLEVEIFSEFTVGASAKGNVELLDKARGRGDIDQQTHLEELQRYGILAENRDVEAIIERTKAEGPPGGLVAGNPAAFGTEPQGDPLDDTQEPPTDPTDPQDA